jgi:4'-phosphopantetheinyl transferase
LGGAVQVLDPRDIDNTQAMRSADIALPKNRPTACFDLPIVKVALMLIELDQPEKTVKAMRSQLLIDEQTRADRYVNPKDANRYIVGRFAMRCELARYLNTNAQNLKFGMNRNGKPFLEQFSECKFNLSHSAGLGVLAVVQQPSNLPYPTDMMIGVDVEWQKSLIDETSLFSHCLSAAELLRVNQLIGPDRLDAFFEIWVRKEASLKALGLGFTVGPASFDSGWSNAIGLKSRLPSIHICDQLPVHLISVDLRPLLQSRLEAQTGQAAQLNDGLSSKCRAAIATVSARASVQHQGFFDVTSQAVG